MKLTQLLLPAAIGVSLALSATGAKAQDCPELRGTGQTRAIIGANTEYRANAIWNVVVANNWQQKGFYCQKSDGKTVWMSKPLSGPEEALQIFNRFRDAGLTRPLKIRQAR